MPDRSRTLQIESIEASGTSNIVVLAHAEVDARHLSDALDAARVSYHLEEPGSLRIVFEPDEAAQLVQAACEALRASGSISTQTHFNYLVRSPLSRALGVGQLERIFEQATFPDWDEPDAIPTGPMLVLSQDHALDLLRERRRLGGSTVTEWRNPSIGPDDLELIGELASQEQEEGRTLIVQRLFDSALSAVSDPEATLTALGELRVPFVCLVDYGSAADEVVDAIDSTSADILIRNGCPSSDARTLLRHLERNPDIRSIDDYLSTLNEVELDATDRVAQAAALKILKVPSVGRNELPSPLRESLAEINWVTRPQALLRLLGKQSESNSHIGVVHRLAIVIVPLLRELLSDHGQSAWVAAQVLRRAGDYDARLLPMLLERVENDVVDWSTAQDELRPALSLLRWVKRSLAPRSVQAILGHAADLLPASDYRSDPATLAIALRELNELSAGTDSALTVRESIRATAIESFSSPGSPSARKAYYQVLRNSPRFGEVLDNGQVLAAIQEGAAAGATLADALTACEALRQTVRAETKESRAEDVERAELEAFLNIDWIVNLAEGGGERGSLEEWARWLALSYQLRTVELNPSVPDALVASASLRSVATTLEILKRQGFPSEAHHVWRQASGTWIDNQRAGVGSAAGVLVRSAVEHVGPRATMQMLNRSHGGNTLFEKLLQETTHQDPSLGLAARLLDPLLRPGSRRVAGRDKVLRSAVARLTERRLERALSSNPWRPVFSSLARLVSEANLTGLDSVVEANLARRVEESLIRSNHRGDELKLAVSMLESGHIDGDSLVGRLAPSAKVGLKARLTDCRSTDACVAAHRFARMLQPEVTRAMSTSMFSECIERNSSVGSRPEIALELLSEIASTVRAGTATQKRSSRDELVSFLPSSFLDQLPERLLEAATRDSAWRALHACRRSMSWIGSLAVQDPEAMITLTRRLSRHAFPSLRFLQQMQRFDPDLAERVRSTLRASTDFAASLDGYLIPRRSLHTRAEVGHLLEQTGLADLLDRRVTADEVLADLGQTTNVFRANVLLDWLVLDQGVNEVRRLWRSRTNTHWVDRLSFAKERSQIDAELSLVQKLAALGPGSYSLSVCENVLNSLNHRPIPLAGQLANLLFAVDLAEPSQSAETVKLLDRCATRLRTGKYWDRNAEAAEDLEAFEFARFVQSGRPMAPRAPVGRTSDNMELSQRTNYQLWVLIMEGVADLQPLVARTAGLELLKRYTEGRGRPSFTVLANLVQLNALAPDRLALPHSTIGEMVTCLEPSWEQKELMQRLWQTLPEADAA